MARGPSLEPLRAFLTGRFIGHPLHALVVHFPLALFPTSLLFDLISWFTSDRLWPQAALLNVAVGLLGAVVAIATGLVDYVNMIAGSLRHQVSTVHLVLNSGAVGLFGLGLVLRLQAGPVERTPAAVLVLSLLGTGLLLLGGYLGGYLVYRMAMRVSTRADQAVPLEQAVIGLVRRLFGRRES
jgi:uncharacterized membrane protein